MPEIRFKFGEYFHPWTLLRLRRQLERTQWLSEADLQAFQMRRLRAVLQRAYRYVPYYRSAFDSRGLVPDDIRAPGDLAKLPVLEKATLRRCFGELTATDARRFSPRRTESSGTTSEPVGFLLDRHSRIAEFVYYWRHWSWAGYRLGQRFAQLNAQEFIHGSAGDALRFQRSVNRLLLNSGALSEQTAPRMATALRKYRPRYLKGLAGPLFYLADLFREMGVDDLELNAVFSTGETLYPARRRVIEEVFHCPVLDSYGLLEQAAGISQCERGGYHIAADYALMELVPDGGRSGDAPLFRVIGTTLYNQAMPLIRYDVGDLVEPAPAGERCSCGRTLPLVRAIHGRREDAVLTRDGRYVTALFLVPEQVKGVHLVQFVQEDEDHLEARVVAGAEFDQAEEASFHHYTRRLVGEAIDVTILRVEEEQIIRGPTGKVPLVLSHLPRARAEG